MPGKLKKMIGLVILVYAICGVSCVGVINTIQGEDKLESTR